MEQPVGCPDGNSVSFTFTFQQTGSELTGTVETRDGTVEISSGKVEGDSISFITKLNTQGAFISNKGFVKEDEIVLATMLEGWPGGVPTSLTLKRAK